MKNLPIKCNKYIPFKGFYAINLFGIIYKRQEYCSHQTSTRTINHEGIHSCQAEDFVPNKNNSTFKRILGYCIFYIIYFIEWLIKLICNIFYWKIRAYKSISFEQEAYNNDKNYTYQDTRKRWASFKYIFKFVINE